MKYQLPHNILHVRQGLTFVLYFKQLIENVFRCGRFSWFVHYPHFSSRFSTNSEAFASELIENLEDISPQYYMYSDMFNMFKCSNAQWCITRRESDLKTCLSIDTDSCNDSRKTFMLRYLLRNM